MLARLGEQLSAIHSKGLQDETAIRCLAGRIECAVLPLDHCGGAGGVLRVGDGAIVGGLVETIGGEGVGYSCTLGLVEGFRLGVVEVWAGQYFACACFVSCDL